MPLSRVVIRMMVSFDGSTLGNLPLQRRVIGHSHRLAFKGRIELALCPRRFPFCFTRCLQHVPFPIPRIVFIYPSLSAGAIFVFFLVRLIHRFGSLLYIQFLLCLGRLPFSVLRTNSSFGSQVNIAFRFSVQAMYIALCYPLVFKGGIGGRLPTAKTVLMRMRCRFLLSHSNHPSVPLPCPFTSAILLFRGSFIMAFVAAGVEIFGRNRSRHPMGIFRRFNHSTRRIVHNKLFGLGSTFARRTSGPLRAREMSVTRLTWAHCGESIMI